MITAAAVTDETGRMSNDALGLGSLRPSIVGFENDKAIAIAWRFDHSCHLGDLLGTEKFDLLARRALNDGNTVLTVVKTYSARGGKTKIVAGEKAYIRYGRKFTVRKA